MSEITQNFVVEPNNINITVDTNNINFTPNTTQLSIFTSAPAVAGGSNTQLQFNDNNQFGGIPNVTWNGSNLSLGNVANIKITGGTNGYVLQTDGTGNLSWTAQSGNGGGGNGTPGGSNTQIQYNDSGLFGGNAGFTFNEVSGNVNLPNNLIVVGTVYGSYNGDGSALSNITGANVTGQVNFSAVANSVAGANVSGAVSFATTANSVAGANVSGQVNFAAVANSVAGANVSGTVSSATTAGTVTVGAQPNITSLGTLTSLKISSDNIALGNLAGNNAQSTFGIAIGRNAGSNIQGTDSIAIGRFAANSSQGANSIAIGPSAGTVSQGAQAIAIGHAAGANSQSNWAVAIGYNSATLGAQGVGAVTIGSYAGSLDPGDYSIGIGYFAGRNIIGNNSILLNATGANLDIAAANSFVVKPIRNASAGNILYYDQSSGEITYQTNSGGSTAAGANTQVQYNSGGALDASANFTFNSATNNLTVTGNVVGTHYGAATGLTSLPGSNIAGNIVTGNSLLFTANYVSNVGNVTNRANYVYANVFVGDIVNTNSGSFTTVTGSLTTAAQPNVTSLGTITSLVATTMKVTPTTVAGLPSASSAGVGARRFVTDASSSPGSFGAIVVGSGVTPLPVFSDGTNWRIG